MRGWSLFWSGFFHPIFLPTFVALMAFWLQPFELLYYPPQLQMMVLLQVFVMATVLPFGAVLLLMRFNRVSSVMVEDRSERSLPYLIQALCLASLVFVFRRMGIANVLIMSVVGSMLAVLAAWYINRRWKISAHTIGMGGLTAFIFTLHQSAQQPVFLPLLLAIIFAGIVGSARLQLQAHSPKQIYAGYFLGIGCMLLAMIPYWLKI